MDVTWAVFLFALGACVGSFLNVVIFRLPHGGSIFFPPRSFCPSCGRTIKWYDNVPLLSWLLLRARCRFCKTPISPRYIVVEAVTAVLVSGLYVCYYVLRLRDGAGEFADTWPMFLAHAALLCGLLVCSVVDIESWIVPLEVCWVVSLVGVVCATASPHAWVQAQGASPALGAARVAAMIGLAIAILLMRYGFLQPSFLDAEESVVGADQPLPAKGSKKKSKPGKGPSEQKPIRSVAITKAHGIDPRKEILREVLFLGPAIVLAVVAYVLVTRADVLGDAWGKLNSGRFGRHFAGFQAALLGYLIGGLWVWGIRIFGTLAFGKEAMGLGDVHLMAAVGAVAGWSVPSIAFFVAPLFGLLRALYLWIRRNQRELPYGPWLAAGTLIVMLFYDAFAKFLAPCQAALGQ